MDPPMGVIEVDEDAVDLRARAKVLDPVAERSASRSVAQRRGAVESVTMTVAYVAVYRLAAARGVERWYRELQCTRCLRGVTVSVNRLLGSNAPPRPATRT